MAEKGIGCYQGKHKWRGLTFSVPTTHHMGQHVLNFSGRVGGLKESFALCFGG
jgi:hypothetical protein